MKLRAELQQALEHESHVVTTTARHVKAACDQRVRQSVQNEARLEDNLTGEALEEMTVMRQKLHEQELAVQKIHQDAAFEIQCRDSEIQRKANITSTELDDVTKRKDFEVENLQSELAQVKQKAVFDLEKERAEYAKQMQHQAPVYSEAHQTNPYNTLPAARWAATAQVLPAVAHQSPELSFGVSASNVHNLESREGGLVC